MAVEARPNEATYRGQQSHSSVWALQPPEVPTSSDIYTASVKSVLWTNRCLSVRSQLNRDGDLPILGGVRAGAQVGLRAVLLMGA